MTQFTAANFKSIKFSVNSTAYANIYFDPRAKVIPNQTKPSQTKMMRNVWLTCWLNLHFDLGVPTVTLKSWRNCGCETGKLHWHWHFLTVSSFTFNSVCSNLNAKGRKQWVQHKNDVWFVNAVDANVDLHTNQAKWTFKCIIVMWTLSYGFSGKYVFVL